MKARHPGESRRRATSPTRAARIWRALTWVALALGVLLPAWAFWLEPSSLVTTETRLELPGWPASCNGLRLAVLSDLHVGSPYNGLERLDDVVAATNAVAPDLALLAGDYVSHGVVGGEPVSPPAIAERLAALKATSGVYAVLGNHDVWYGGSAVRAALESAGIVVLEDHSVRVAAGGCELWITGLRDLWGARPDPAAALADVVDEAPVVAFTHNPDLFPRIPARVDLTIAGHTHGGQVYLPFLGRLIVPSEYGERFAIGHVVEDGRHLFVTPGIGTSIIPVRFLVPPEISVLELLTAAD